MALPETGLTPTASGKPLMLTELLGMIAVTALALRSTTDTVPWHAPLGAGRHVMLATSALLRRLSTAKLIGAVATGHGADGVPDKLPIEPVQMEAARTVGVGVVRFISVISLEPWLAVTAMP